MAVNYRSSKAEAEDLAERIKGMGVPCLLVPGDVAQPAEARRVVARVIEEWKRLDILVNNAGITRDRSMRKLADEEWADVINVNLNGTFYCTSAAIPDHGGAELRPHHQHQLLCRAGRQLRAGQLRGEQGRHHRVHQVAGDRDGEVQHHRQRRRARASPPPTCSRQVPANIQDQLKTKIPLGRFGTPEEVAKTVAFLATEGDYITGQQINVNGGIYM